MQLGVDVPLSLVREKLMMVQHSYAMQNDMRCILKGWDGKGRAIKTTDAHPTKSELFSSKKFRKFAYTAYGYVYGRTEKFHAT